MLKYNKSGLIATSHVHIHDTENIILACNIFKVIIITPTKHSGAQPLVETENR